MTAPASDGIIRTVDAHVGGQALRLVVDGYPRPAGRGVAQRGDWLARHADARRRALLLEPRGHGDMSAALFTDADAPGSHAGLIFMDRDGYPPMSGHGVIAAATIALERGLLFDRAADAAAVRLHFDTAAGTVHALARVDGRGDALRVHSVTLTSVPAFVHAPGLPVALGARDLRVDIAYGGLFHAMVDTEAIGIPLELERLPELRRLASDIARVVNRTQRPVHPTEPRLSGLAGVVFTGPPHDPEAHLRSIAVTAGGACDRCASVTGTSAMMAVLDAMGLLPHDEPFVHEGPIGTLVRGTLARRTAVGDLPALVTDVEASARITGEHTFFIDESELGRGGSLADAD